METKHAVILVAGDGKRLRPFTDSSPKCFASVNGKRILDNALYALSGAGCEHVRIVTGHFADLVRRTITESFAGMKIEYVVNAAYSSTNSMFSLALGLANWDLPTWVIEGDVFMDPVIFKLPASPEIAWFVDSSTRHLDGAYVADDGKGRALSLEIVRDLSALRSEQSKSVGTLKLTRRGAGLLHGWLREGIAAGRQNVYYDLILGDHMAETDVSITDVAGHKWYEIDTHLDLQHAVEMFS